MIEGFKMPFFVLLGLIFFPLSSMAKTHIFCDHALSEIAGDASPTQQFNAYTARLLSEGVLTNSELESFVEALKAQKKITNPFGDSKLSKNTTDNSRQIHAENLQNYIDHAPLDYKEILTWAEAQLATLNHRRHNKEATDQATQQAYIKMKLYPIKARTFPFINYLSESINITLTEDFEMMSTPVTQGMWLEIMQTNPAFFKDHPHHLDNPIEKISWWSALEFANRLSEKMGYKKVYDFSAVQFKPGTSAEKGDLAIARGTLKINGPSVYQTLGYRLPTVFEQKMILEHLIRTPDINEKNILDFAWLSPNSDGRPHPVMEKLPFIIDSNPFFDLVGNVDEWSNDSMCYDIDVTTNPVGPQDCENRIVAGQAFHHSKSEAFGKNNLYGGMNTTSSSTGFRLVRSLPKP